MGTPLKSLSPGISNLNAGARNFAAIMDIEKSYSDYENTASFSQLNL